MHFFFLGKEEQNLTSLSTFLSLYLLLHCSSIIFPPPQVTGRNIYIYIYIYIKTRTLFLCIQSNPYLLTLDHASKSRRTYIFYFLHLKKKTAENRINLNFLTFNYYYYYSGLVLIISVNSDSLVAKCRQVNDHGGNYSPQQTKTTNTL